MTTFFDRPDLEDADRELLQLISVALEQAEPVPPAALDQALAARLMSAVEAEVAELVFDSLTMPTAPMRRGAEGESRFLSFTNDHLTVDLVLMADRRTIVGQLDPAIADEVRLELSHGVMVDTAVDRFGRFRTTCDAASFRLRVPGHLVTPWISRQSDEPEA